MIKVEEYGCECPECFSLNSVSGLEKYQIICCWNCGICLEFDGEDLDTVDESA